MCIRDRAKNFGISQLKFKVGLREVFRKRDGERKGRVDKNKIILNFRFTEIKICGIIRNIKAV